jgi:hypothetical protein
MDAKTCSVCGETKPLAEFGRSARGAGGRRSQCKKCNATAVKARYVCQRPSACRRWWPGESLHPSVIFSSWSGVLPSWSGPGASGTTLLR